MSQGINEIVTRMLLTGDVKLLSRDDRYAISKDGALFSRAGNRTRYSRVWIKKGVFYAGSRKEYIYCHLDDSSKSFGVHTLVAQTFHGDCGVGQEVRHLDGNPANNNFKNLAFGTRKQNMEDAVAHGTMQKGEACHNSVLNMWSVRIIRDMLASGYTQRHIAKKIDCSEATIWCVKHKKTWKWLDACTKRTKARTRHRAH